MVRFRILLLLFSSLIILNLYSQNNSGNKPKNRHIDFNQTYLKFQDSYHKRVRYLNSTETFRDSSIFYLFETNYDSSSINKDHYKYNELGLLVKWEFYRRGYQNRELPWYIDFYITYLYDNNNNLIEQVHTMWLENLQEYSPYSKYEAIYNDEGLKTKYTTYKWSNGKDDWFLENESFFEYDSLGNPIYYEKWGYDYTWDEYHPEHKWISEYNENNNVESTLWHVWDRQDSAWKNLYLLGYAYDNQQNNILYTTSYWNNYSGEWWDGKREEMEYNVNDKRIKRTFYERDSDSSQWQSVKNFDYEYNQENDLIVNIESRWNEDSMRLIALQRNEYNYDEYGFLKDDIYVFRNIDTISDFWKIGYKNFYINDSAGNVLMDGFADWISYSEGWAYERKEFHYYSNLITGFPDDICIDYTLSPNPSTGSFYINCPKEPIEKITIYSLNSIPLYSKEVNSNSEIIDISNLNPGKYVLQLTFGYGRKESQIIVKL